MALAKEEKAEVIGRFSRHEGDTGSPEVQVALLTKRIEELTEHLKVHKKDYHSPARIVQDDRPAPGSAELPAEEGY